MKYANAAIGLGVIGYVATIVGIILTYKRYRIFAMIYFIISAVICLSSFVIGGLALSDSNKITSALLNSPFSVIISFDILIGAYLVYYTGIIMILLGIFYLFICAGSFVYCLNPPDDF